VIYDVCKCLNTDNALTVDTREECPLFGVGFSLGQNDFFFRRRFFFAKKKGLWGNPDLNRDHKLPKLAGYQVVPLPPERMGMQEF
jgi:hypothetical protein